MVERYRGRSSGSNGRGDRERDDRDDRKDGRSERGPSTRSKWHYEPQKAERIQERATRTGGRFDSIFKQGVDSWRPKAGDNTIRLLPGTWGLGVHYAYDIFVHRNVGADDSTYLCLDKMLSKPCPVCDAAAEAKRARDDEDAKALRWIEQKAAYILDRDGDQKLTPQIWVMSWTLDRDVAALTHDKKKGTYLIIDDPDNGYDLTIKRSGTGLNTRYFGLMIDRDPTPLADKARDVDKVLEFIGSNPIPDMLNFYDADYLDKVLSGTSGSKDKEDDKRGAEVERDDRGRERERERDRDEPEERGRDRGAEPRDEPEERTSRRSAREEPEEPRGRSARDEPEERRGRGARDEPEERPSRRGAREEVEDERPSRARDDDDKEPPPRRARDADADDAPRGRRDEPEERRGRGNGRSRDDDEPPFDTDASPGRGRGRDRDEPEERTTRRGREPEEDDRPRRASSRDEPEERGTRRGEEPRGRGRDEEEDRRPSRRR